MLLLQGDCLDLMGSIPDNSVDMILTDLPYNITACDWDVPIDLTALWKQYERVLKPNAVVCLFAAGLFTYSLIQSNLKHYKYKLIWKKNVPTGMASAKYRPMKYYEEILIFHYGRPAYNPILKPRIGKGKDCYHYNHYCGDSNHVKLDKLKKLYDPDYVQPSDVLEFNVVPNRKGKLHSTQKPVDLLEYLIKTYTNEGDVILDSCMGSGSTGVACLNTSRDFIGIELSPDIFAVARARVESHTPERH